MTTTVIIGGVAGGMSTATRLRRRDEDMEIIVLEASGYVSFANCGLPYHLSAVTQAVARTALAHREELLGKVALLRTERDALAAHLAGRGHEVAPSDANFVLFGGLADAPATWQALLDRGVLVRDVGIPHHLRVTAGTPEETGRFLAAMTELVTTHASSQEAS